MGMRFMVAKSDAAGPDEVKVRRWRDSVKEDALHNRMERGVIAAVPCNTTLPK